MLPHRPALRSARPTDDRLLWTDRVCGSYLPSLELASNPPPEAVLNEPAAAGPAVSGYLDDALRATDRLIVELDRVGPSPFGASGADAVARTRAAAVGNQGRITEYQEDVDARAGTPMDTRIAALRTQTVILTLHLQNPMLYLRTVFLLPDEPALNVPNCARLKDVRPPTFPAPGGRPTVPPISELLPDLPDIRDQIEPIPNR